jgi:aryl-alcohol dehydrogenase-like predicted oxidoreductase
MSSSVRKRLFTPRRELGRTGFKATMLGIGDVADRALPLEQCVAVVHRAMDAGLNVIDTAPAYENGYSEEIVGAALKDRRNGMFVIDKIDHSDKPVKPQVNESLKRLGLKSVDLFVFHTVSATEQWERLVVKGGGMDQLGECVHEGKVRFRGISSHHPEVLRSAIVSGLCDVVMFAVGPHCDRRYLEDTLPLARCYRIGAIGFKTFGAGKLLGDTTGYGTPLDSELVTRLQTNGKNGKNGKSGPAHPLLPRLSAEECVRYSLTCDPDVALLGLSVPEEQDVAFAAAADFKPLNNEEMADVRRRAALAVQNKGQCWWNPPE